MEITRGKIRKGVKFLIYGPEGIGKSTFASKIPGVVFIDTEGSTGELDVLRFPSPKSWTALMSTVQYAIAHPEQVQALCIDTGDWAERLCLEHILATHLINGQPMQSIEDAGYGKGYVYLYEEFGKLLDKMQELSDKGIHCGFTAHAMMRKFEQPDELGSYDRWELKMSKKVAPLIKEWSSLMLFANYKTLVYATDDKGKKHKASGGQRVMYANHHPCWDAKNRYGLPDELPFDYEAVKDLFIPIQQVATEQVSAVDDATTVSEKPAFVAVEKVSEVPPLASAPQNGAKEKPVAVQDPVMAAQAAPTKPVSEDELFKGVPAKLKELMMQDAIMPMEVKAAIAQKGYFPMETPFENYPEDFVNGVLIGAWSQVKAMVYKNREDLPF